VSLPFPRQLSRLTKRKTNTPPPGFKIFHAGLTVLPLFSWVFCRLSRKLHHPKTIAHACTWNAFPNVQTKFPKQEPYVWIFISEATPESYLNKGSIVRVWQVATFSTRYHSLTTLGVEKLNPLAAKIFHRLSDPAKRRKYFKMGSKPSWLSFRVHLWCLCP